MPLRCLIYSYHVKAQCTINSGSSLVSQCLGKCDNVFYHVTFLPRVVLYYTSFFVHILYLIGLLPPCNSVSRLSLSSLIHINSDKYSGIRWRRRPHENVGVIVAHVSASLTLSE